MIQHITTRETLKRLRGVFRKWLQAGYMARTPIYNVTSRNHPPEIHLPPVPLELSEPTLSEREILAVHAKAPAAAAPVPLNPKTQAALEKYHGRRKRREVLAKALAQASAIEASRPTHQGRP